MIAAAEQTYSFAEFEVDAKRRQLTKNAQTVPLNPKAFDLLLVLIENFGRIVTKEELLETVWANQFVEENNLTVHISALRKIFGEKKGAYQFIVTVPGKGYKFVADIRPVFEESRQNNSNDPVFLEKFLPADARENFETGETLIGRKREIDEIKDLICRDEIRLITLSGAGGSGKTSLALAIAAELKKDFTDGVFFVELAAATESNLVISAIAQTLEITEASGKSLLETIKDFLRTRRLLMILDNFEQVLCAAPIVREILTETSKLKIFVTSRAALRLNIEREFPVQPLDSPPPNAAFSIEKLNEFPAIELFKTRSQAVKPNFALTDENSKIIAEICRKLDGLPLAIELAAVRVKLFAPQAILERLENSLQLLTGGVSDSPERQRTMRGAIRWSYDLLSGDEQFLFRRLAIFAGGFTVEAAEFIIEEEKKQQEKTTISENNFSVSSSPLLLLSSSVLDLLSSLIDNNLLISKEQADGNARLQMLEVVREFAFEMLSQTGELSDSQKAHAEFFLVTVERAEPFLHGETSGEWLEKLEKEHDNIRAALRWSLAGDAQTAARLASALRFFWSNHSHLSEGLHWSSAALQMTESNLSPARSKLLLSNGLFLRNRGDLQAARILYEKCVTESRELNDAEQINKAFQGLGSIAVLEKDYVSAQKFYQKSLAMSREKNDEMQLAYNLGSLGDLEMCQGNLSVARPLLEESLKMSVKRADKRVQTVMYFNLGTIDYFEKSYEQAALNFAESLRIAKKLGYKTMISCALEGFAACAAAAGNFRQSAKLAGAANSLYEEIGYTPEPAEEIFRADYLAKTRAALDEKTFAAFYAQGGALNLDESAALALQRQSAAKNDYADENISEIIIENHTFERITIEEIEPEKIIQPFPKILTPNSAKQNSFRRLLLPLLVVLAVSAVGFGFWFWLIN